MQPTLFSRYDVLMIWLYAIPLAFLAGAIPFGLLIARAKGIDIRTVGSKNIGASNVGRVLGKKYFFLCFALDFLKGLAPVLIAAHLAGVLGQFSVSQRDAWLWLACMVAPVLGHMFNPFLKFKGGKGVATSLGALLAVYPHFTLLALAAFLVFAIVAASTRYVSAGAIAAAIALPLMSLSLLLLPETLTRILSGQTATPPTPAANAPFVVVAFLLGAVIVWAHRSNIARLRAGTENRIGQRIRATP